MRERNSPGKRYQVWSDSESRHVTLRDFDDPEGADAYASAFVHQFDGEDYRVIVHVEDREIDDTIGTYENLNACDVR